MKFSTALVLSGSAVASAAVVPKGTTTDYCPVVAKTVTLSWIELKEFSSAETWSWEQTSTHVQNSKPDLSQVYTNLNKTTTSSGKGYSTGSSKTSSTKTSATPYPTGGLYNNGTGTSGAAAASGTISAAASSSSTSTASGTCTSPKVRTEWRNLDDSQRDAWVAGVKCLMNLPSSNSDTFPGSRNLFEDLTSLHQQLTSVVHGYGTFLVWHRYFLNVFDSLLEDECAYSGPPVWWDETQDSGNFANAPMFTTRWLGEMPAGVDGQGVCITESGFGAYEANVGPDSAVNNPHCLSRAVDDSQTANTSQDWVDSCNGAQNYDDFRSCNELTYHAYGHNGIGAVMSNVAASPEDPTFFLHHGFIDHAYRSWQTGGSTRNYEVGGASPSGGTVSPTDTLTSYGLRADVTVADVLDTEGDYLCYVYDKE